MWRLRINLLRLKHSGSPAIQRWMNGCRCSDRIEMWNWEGWYCASPKIPWRNREPNRTLSARVFVCVCECACVWMHVPQSRRDVTDCNGWISKVMRNSLDVQCVTDALTSRKNRSRLFAPLHLRFPLVIWIRGGAFTSTPEDVFNVVLPPVCA